MREAVESLTNAYFYAPCFCLDRGEIAILRSLLNELNESPRAVQPRLNPEASV
jgi:hypothetical protein